MISWQIINFRAVGIPACSMKYNKSFAYGMMPELFVFVYVQREEIHPTIASVYIFS